MMLTVLLLAASVAAAPVALPGFKGVLVTGQFRCDDFLCPDWELDVARVDPAFREHLITKLAELVPKSPVASMSFPVYTAFHNATRSFYTVGLPQSSGGILWGVTIDGPVNTSTTLFPEVHFTYPDGMGPVNRIHVTSNNTVIAIMNQGTVVSIDTRSGALKTIGTVIPSTIAARVAPGSLVNDADILYTVLVGDGGVLLSSLDLVSGKLSTVPITLKKERWAVESVFQAVWVQGKVIILIAGLDTGFDSIASIDPATGDGTFLNQNLAENQLFFTCDMSTKSCDVLQTAAYDAIENRLYFQATNIQSTDDLGTTVLMYMDLAAKQPYIDTGLNPFTFGYMGFQFVKVLSS